MFAKPELLLFGTLPLLFCFFSLVALVTGQISSCSGGEFVRTRGIQFVVDERVFYPNGFNAYWLMTKASEDASNNKEEVSVALRQATRLGLNVVRTWAFSDGGYKPLQYSPGSYDEAMFQGLDFVIAEAKKYGLYVILSLVNNHEDFGGRKQYVEWARKQQQHLDDDDDDEAQQHNLSSDDDFYTDQVVKGYYTNHVKTVLTRNNTITGVAYKDEPTIMAWELMNEPRCLTDLSGQTLQGWIAEMATYVKSIDSNHLVEVGLEGFYGGSMPTRAMEFNPNGSTATSAGVGTDFIANNQLPGIDFATIHAYPDQWIPESDATAQLSFLQRWIMSHVHDAAAVLHKPLLVAEFGKYSSSRTRSRQRDALYSTVYDTVYESTKSCGACAGALFWQLLLGKGAMDVLRDGYEIVVSESPSTAQIIARHSRKLRALPLNSYIFEN